MAEFGENIRKARERMGITQQTLADKLYVTRQAVSRWENGSRYPDLLTAKRLAASLDTSLDKLLNNDDMHTYPEVNPVLEYPVHKRVQTALFAAAFTTNLLQLLWQTGFMLIEHRFLTEWETTTYYLTIAVLTVITGTLLYGAIKSVRDTVTPRVAALIAAMIVGVDMLNELALYFINWQNHLNNENTGIGLTIYLTMDIAFIILVLIFFLSKKAHSPIPIYVIAGLETVLFLSAYTWNLIGAVGTAQLTKFMMTSSLKMFAVLLIPTLFVYMTAVLYRKRRLTKQ
ncbi:MAG: helix-turn-helix transcriptional regulator [Ruminococcus sp.]|nr:helix-turn-helix transcriptional regulator [Ruminococcus sp.]